MEVFEIKDDQVVFSPQALMLEPFADIWNRDKSKGKTKALTEMAAVYFYTDYKSDFSEMLNDDEKLSTIKSVIVGMDPKWEPDDLFKKACKFYSSRQETPATLLLEDARHAVQSVRKFLREIDMSEEVGGRPKHDIKKVIDSLGQLNKVTEALFELESQVKKQIQQKDDTMRGGKEKSLFEDGID
jgi:hypothetical protein